MRKTTLFAAVAAALLLIGAGCAAGRPSGTASGPASGAAVTAPATGPGASGNAASTGGNAAGTGGKVLVVSMHPKGGDDEIGNVILSEVDANHTRVAITLANAPTNVSEDAGIYGGTCKDLGAPLQYDLGTVAKGRGVTVLNVNFSSFIGGTKQSVRVIAQPADAQSPYWTCGDIR